MNDYDAETGTIVYRRRRKRGEDPGLVKGEWISTVTDINPAHYSFTIAQEMQAGQVKQSRSVNEIAEAVRKMLAETPRPVGHGWYPGYPGHPIHPCVPTVPKYPWDGVFFATSDQTNANPAKPRTISTSDSDPSTGI